jgi:hypothetical protein
VTRGNLNVGNDCGRCGRGVIRRQDGLTLEPVPHSEGVYRADGGIIAPLDAIHAYYGTKPAVGHRVHRCAAVEAEVAGWRTAR